MLSVFLLSALFSVCQLSSVITPSAVRLSVVMLSVIMLSVVAPFLQLGSML